MLLVGLNINQFARRSASPGSLYTYIVQGMGPTAGVMGGWALMFGYTLTGMSTLCGFAIIADLLLGRILGLQLGMLGWMVIGACLAGYIAARNVQMSAKTMRQRAQSMPQDAPERRAAARHRRHSRAGPSGPHGVLVYCV